MDAWILLAVLVVVVLLLALTRLPLLTWTLGLGALLVVALAVGKASLTSALVLGGSFLLLALLLNWPALRRQLLSRPLLARIRRVLPPMSDTERTAIEAGTVWWDAELFQGEPRWERLLSTPAPRLSEAEQAFLDGPVEELCRGLDDWQINQELHDLPEEIWRFLGEHRFFGLMIPKRYGGHAFSALGHSSVVMKVASRSGVAGVTVMVPNSLGPAELLLHYGTDAQKDHYLPRLARGEEIPCFALTGPTAGSDAGAIPDIGIVCRGSFEGREALGLRVTWEKRYITLGPVATVLGLAFKAYDPQHLLGAQEDLGITCALIPTATPGVEIGRRHDPGTAFMNGPNAGKDVFIPMDWVIGGEPGVGAGWRMLMESLAAGRGISLPALGAGAGKFASRVTGAYARVRRQFKTPIGRFEGVEEALARIGGLTYRMEAARTLTTAALDLGERPSVISAILKYHLTEGYRQAINDAMDVHGGKGICLGPSNYLGQAYRAVPVSITVEGANILTRSMILFGQGAMRCHPYLTAEVTAAGDPDRHAGLVAFDRAIFSHLGYTLRNLARAWVQGLSGGRLAATPEAGSATVYYRRINRLSASFAMLSDLSLMILGSSFKRREKLSGRFGDALSHLYLASATLKRFQDDGRPAADLPLMHWACQDSLARVEQALDGVLRNFPVPGVGGLLRVLAFPLGQRLCGPDDHLGHQVASLLLEPGEVRDRLTAGIYTNQDPEDPTGRLEVALQAVLRVEPVERRLRRERVTQPPMMAYPEWVDLLRRKVLISGEEAQWLKTAQEAVEAAIQVDDFPASRQAGVEDKDRAA